MGTLLSTGMAGFSLGLSQSILNKWIGLGQVSNASEYPSNLGAGKSVSSTLMGAAKCTECDKL